jgi:hypothetical protein
MTLWRREKIFRAAEEIVFQKALTNSPIFDTMASAVVVKSLINERFYRHVLV